MSASKNYLNSVEPTNEPDDMVTSRDPESDVLSVINSSDDFHDHFNKIVRAIAHSSKHYDDTLLFVINNILVSSSRSPVQKFYALYLLLKLSELRSE